MSGERAEDAAGAGHRLLDVELQTGDGAATTLRERLVEGRFLVVVFVRHFG